MSVFQDLYHSEINFRVSCFWDGGFAVELGDDMNGIRAQTNCDRWGQIEPWLINAAIEHFPESLFAEMYRDGLSVWLEAFPRRENPPNPLNDKP